MNHARIAAEALRYRLDLLEIPPASRAEFDLDAMAGATVAAADQTVDGALRRIATAWVRAGLDPEKLCERWASPETRALFEANRGWSTRSMTSFASPRTPCETPRNRPSNYRSGSNTRTRAPPSGRLLTSIRPRCESMMVRAIASPSPLDPPVSPRRKRSKT